MITIMGNQITVSKKDGKAVWLLYKDGDIVAHGTTEPLKLVETTEKSEKIYEVENIQIKIEREIG